jgi:hypothetical protein
VRIICYPNDLIDKFHQHLKVPSDLIIRNGNTISQEVNNLINVIDGKRSGDLTPDAVWRSNKIGPLHLIVTPDIVYQYVVMPEFNGTKNKIIGFKSEDAFVIEFLKQTYFDYESDAVTPICERLDKNKIKLIFDPFQENIKQMEIYLSETDNVIVSDEVPKLTLEFDNSITLQEKEINGVNLENAKFLKLVLIKGNGAKSQPSKLVRIPD